MKDQYFGDENDFRKYGLLRTLVADQALKLGVCWMLTESDGRSDGNKLRYLGQPDKYRGYDPVLFDWLRDVVEVEQERWVGKIEQSNLLEGAVFQSRLLTDRAAERAEYFKECSARFRGCDLVFFDPDNGFEVASRAMGRRHSSKHVYWSEVTETFRSGSSVLIYQHFARQERLNHVAKIVSRLRHVASPHAIFSFTTSHVVFVLASHAHHQATFRGQSEILKGKWNGQITPKEHNYETDSPRRI